jgi:TP901 family phage tail tape measure protein
MTAKKIQLDATSAVKQISDMSTAVQRYNTRIKSLHKQTATYRDTVKSLNRVTDTTHKRFTTLNQDAGAFSTAVRGMTTILEQQRLALEATNEALGRHVQLKQQAAAQPAPTTGGHAGAYLRGGTKVAPDRSLEIAQRNAIRWAEQQRRRAYEPRRVDAAGQARPLIQQADATRKLSVAQTKASQTTGLLSGQLNRMARVMVSAGIVIVLYRFVSALSRSAQAAVEFSIRISEVRTISDRAAMSVSRWRQELTALSSEFGVSSLESAEAAYQALSNQVTNATNTMSFMRQEVLLSVTAVSTLDEAVSATTAILNAFDLGIADTAHTNAILFKTVELGRVRLSELGDTIGRVSILSQQLGVSFVEQQAAISMLSIKGVKAEEAITLLRNVFLKLTKPTERMKEIFDSWGVSSGQAAIKIYGLGGVLQKFQEEARKGGDEAQEMAMIFNRLRAMVGATALTQGKLNEEIAKFGTASQDYKEAQKEALESTGRQVKVQMEKIKNYFLENWGKPMTEAFVRWSKYFGGADKMIKSLLIGLRYLTAGVVAFNVVQKIATASLVAHTATTGVQTVAQYGYVSALVATKIALWKVVAAQAAATLGLTVVLALIGEFAVNAAFATDGTTESVQEMQMALDKLNADALEKIADDARRAEEQITRTFKNYAIFFQMYQRSIGALSVDVEAMHKVLDAKIKALLKDAFEPATKYVDALAERLRKLESAIAKRKGTAETRKLDLEARKRVTTIMRIESDLTDRLIAKKERLKKMEGTLRPDGTPKAFKEDHREEIKHTKESIAWMESESAKEADTLHIRMTAMRRYAEELSNVEMAKRRAAATPEDMAAADMYGKKAAEVQEKVKGLSDSLIALAEKNEIVTKKIKQPVWRKEFDPRRGRFMPKRKVETVETEKKIALYTRTVTRLKAEQRADADAELKREQERLTIQDAFIKKLEGEVVATKAKAETDKKAFAVTEERLKKAQADVRTIVTELRKAKTVEQVTALQKELATVGAIANLKEEVRLELQRQAAASRTLLALEQQEASMKKMSGEAQAQTLAVEKRLKHVNSLVKEARTGVAGRLEGVLPEAGKQLGEGQRLARRYIAHTAHAKEFRQEWTRKIIIVDQAIKALDALEKKRREAPEKIGKDEVNKAMELIFDARKTIQALSATNILHTEAMYNVPQITQSMDAISKRADGLLAILNQMREAQVQQRQAQALQRETVRFYATLPGAEKALANARAEAARLEKEGTQENLDLMKQKIKLMELEYLQLRKTHGEVIRNAAEPVTRELDLGQNFTRGGGVSFGDIIINPPAGTTTEQIDHIVMALDRRRRMGTFVT